MRLRTQTTLLLMLAAGLVAGCGADDEGKPIPADAAASLQQRLDSVQARFEFGDGACNDIAEDQQLANRTIDSLPPDVDPDVRKALQQSFDRLFQLTSDQCDETKGQDTQTDTTDTTPTDTTNTETTDTTETQPPPDTTPTDTLPTETVPPTDTAPPAPQDGGTGGGGATGPQDDE